MDCSCQAPLSMGFPRQECWSGLPFLSPRVLPDSGIKPKVSCIAGRFFYHWATWDGLFFFNLVLVFYFVFSWPLSNVAATLCMIGKVKNTRITYNWPLPWFLSTQCSPLFDSSSHSSCVTQVFIYCWEKIWAQDPGSLNLCYSGVYYSYIFANNSWVWLLFESSVLHSFLSLVFCSFCVLIWFFPHFSY